MTHILTIHIIKPNLVQFLLFCRNAFHETLLAHGEGGGDKFSSSIERSITAGKTV